MPPLELLGYVCVCVCGESSLSLGSYQIPGGDEKSRPQDLGFRGEIQPEENALRFLNNRDSHVWEILGDSRVTSLGVVILMEEVRTKICHVLLKWQALG